MSTYLVRPKHYRETIPEQTERLDTELYKTVRHHTIEVAREISKWFDTRKLLGDSYNRADCMAEATAQCHLKGVKKSHIPIVVEIVANKHLQEN